MKKLFFLTLLLCLCFTASSASALTLKLSHVRPQGTSVDIDLNQYAKDVEEASLGRVKIRLYPANALGDYTVVQERVTIGAIDMSCQPTGTAANKRLQLGVLPYLAETWPEAEAAFGLDKPVRQEIEQLLLEQDILVLGAWPAYFGGISLNKEPVEPLNPAVNKNTKLRIPAWKSLALLASATGYQAAALPFSEAFTAIQTGVVDGAMGSGAEGYYSSFRDVTKFYIPANTHFEIWYLMINKDKFDSLSPEDQKALRETAVALEKKRWETGPVEQIEYEKKLEGLGAKIFPVSDELLAEYGRLTREKVWPEVLTDIDKDWAEEVLKKINK